MSDTEINLAIERITGQRRDYCYDLNAMHEAVARLSDEQYLIFVFYLNRVQIGTPEDQRKQQRKRIEATARQRAVAYVRTVGKWKE